METSLSAWSEKEEKEKKEKKERKKDSATWFEGSQP